LTFVLFGGMRAGRINIDTSSAKSRLQPQLFLIMQTSA
jgi:hypothetical protein